MPSAAANELDTLVQVVFTVVKGNCDIAVGLDGFVSLESTSPIFSELFSEAGKPLPIKTM